MHAGDGLDQFGAPCHAALMCFARGTERLATEGGGGLLGGDHDFGIADDLRRRAQLRLQLVRQLLDRKGHASG
ncbi:hypothetical protein D3C73_1568760 [compost metagenome]